MSDIFISYKREDETRVARLVRALERTGRSAWWDRGLAAGENWRQQIQTALDVAKCVIVVWTRDSVGPQGDFVRDEAGQAKRRDVLVPILLDNVAIPLGFGEIQTIDLTHWKGNPRDAFFEDLCAAVTAKLEGHAVPPARGPMKRLVQRLTYSSLASAIGLGVLVVGLNVFGAQDRLCGVFILQPGVSDVCGAMSLGHRPTKAERNAWEDRAPGNCAALRAHIERFPEGAYRASAADMLASRRVQQKQVWTPTTHRLVLFVARDNVPSANEDAARVAALVRARASAERLCKGFAATTSFRLISAVPVQERWQCSRVTGGVTCGLEGEAVCGLEQRSIQEDESCGT
jgi:hypothetical protein